jgi:hypothetical protein
MKAVVILLGPMKELKMMKIEIKVMLYTIIISTSSEIFRFGLKILDSCNQKIILLAEENRGFVKLCSHSEQQGADYYFRFLYNFNGNGSNIHILPIVGIYLLEKHYR